RGILQHLQLKFAVAIDEVSVGEKVHPVVDVDVKRSQQTLVLKGAALEHFLGLDLAGVAEVIEQERAHLPTVAHLFDHDARKGATVPVGRSRLKQVSLLLDAGKLGVALIDDHVQERVAHLLGGDLAEIFPFGAAFEMAALDFVVFNGSVQCLEMEAGDLVAINADFFAPLVEQADPLAEGTDFRYFAGHWENLSTTEDTKDIFSCFTCVACLRNFLTELFSCSGIWQLTVATGWRLAPD